MCARLLFALLLLTAVAAEGQVAVRYRSENNVYLNAGTAAGITVGDRFEVVRGTTVIATLEVIFAAEQSASCRIVAESQAVQAGDSARRIGTPLPARPQPTATPSLPPTTTTSTNAMNREWSPSLSGNISLDVEQARTLGRLSLRARRIADLPLHFRTRLRIANESAGEDGIGGGSRNRLYELSLLYEPFDGRVAIQAGRLGNSPYIGLGYLDGALVRARLFAGLEAGAFAGYRPDVTELTLTTDTTKYGAFVRYSPDDARGGITVAGVRQQSASADAATTFASVDARYAPTPRLSLFAHGRAGVGGIDGQDDEAGIDTMIGAVARLTATTTLTATYERVEPGPEDDLRTPDQVVGDFLRQGARVTLRGRYFHLGGGIRSSDDDVLGDDENDLTVSASAGVNHPNVLGFSLGVDATGFSSALNDGVFVHARLGRRFGAGHMAELSAGGLLVDEAAIDDFTTTTWIRGAVWIELPFDVFARGEVEVSGGDAEPGHRFSVGAGYRF